MRENVNYGCLNNHMDKKDQITNNILWPYFKGVGEGAPSPTIHYTIFIVDPCIGTQVSSKRRDGQFGTHLDPQGPSGIHGYFWQQ